MNNISFADIAIISYGALSLELNYLKFVENYMAKKPEDLLGYSDWMGIPIQPYTISLDRFKSFLLESVQYLTDV